jgi:hypothetical protein
MHKKTDIDLGSGDAIDLELLRAQRETLLGLLTAIQDPQVADVLMVTAFLNTEDIDEHVRGLLTLIDTLLTNSDITL